MGETAVFSINDTNRKIAQIIEDLRRSGSSNEDGRVKAIIITNLEQAQLWSLKLYKEAAEVVTQ